MSDPEAVHRRFEQFVNEASLDGVLALYDADAVLVERGGKLVIGLNAIREYLAGLLAIRPRITIRHRTTIRAGKVAVLISDWELEALDQTVKPSGTAAAPTISSASRRTETGFWRWTTRGMFPRNRRPEQVPIVLKPQSMNGSELEDAYDPAGAVEAGVGIDRRRYGK